jgi:endonuclease-3
VGRELALYGEELASEGVAQVGGAFTDVPAADALVKSSPEAFLLAALFTQGIPAERAWAAPYLLRERLGHLDLSRLARERDAVDEAIGRTPALHRFKHTMAGWVSDAAARLLSCYGGSAARIWEDGPSAIELMERLSAFQGIGRKKAAMVVGLLTRCFGVHVADLEGGTVAYDTQVRRVFLRTGLVDRDTRAEVERAASESLPASPGRLDLPAWLIGRQWCRPAQPLCEACRLAQVCPRLVERQVEGVGARKSVARARRHTCG